MSQTTQRTILNGLGGVGEAATAVSGFPRVSRLALGEQPKKPPSQQI